MATPSSNVGQAGTSVPVGKSATGSAAGMTGTQPGQMGMGANQGTGQMSSQAFSGPASGMQDSMPGGRSTGTDGFGRQGLNATEQGMQGQHHAGRSMMEAIDDWFRDPFNFGMAGLGSRNRNQSYGSQQQGARSEDQLGFVGGRDHAGHRSGGGGFGTGLVPFGADIFSEIDRSLMSLGSFTPSMKLDIHESDSTFHCSVDMPGVSSNDLNVECDDRTRTIHINVRKDRKEEREEDINGARVHRIERASGSGYRALRMPPNCDLSNVQANLANGVLYLTVPKIQGMDSTGRKRITVGSGPTLARGQMMQGQDMSTGMGTTGGTAGTGPTSMGAGRPGMTGGSM